MKSSVTRCWNKNNPNFLHKVPQQYLVQQFTQKVPIFTFAPKVPKYLVHLYKNLKSWYFKNSPIWSHWWREKILFFESLICFSKMEMRWGVITPQKRPLLLLLLLSSQSTSQLKVFYDSASKKWRSIPLNTSRVWARMCWPNGSQALLWTATVPSSHPLLGISLFDTRIKVLRQARRSSFSSAKNKWPTLSKDRLPIVKFPI